MHKDFDVDAFMQQVRNDLRKGPVEKSPKKKLRRSPRKTTNPYRTPLKGRRKQATAIMKPEWLKSPEGRTSRSCELVDFEDLQVDATVWDKVQTKIQKFESMDPKSATLKENHAGPFIKRDCWSLVNFKYNNDVLLYRMLRAIQRKFDTDDRLVIIDPGITAECISRDDLSLDMDACMRCVNGFENNFELF